MGGPRRDWPKIEAEALHMRRMGFSYARIAKELGISGTRAVDICRSAENTQSMVLTEPETKMIIEVFRRAPFLKFDEIAFICDLESHLGKVQRLHVDVQGDEPKDVQGLASGHFAAGLNSGA